MPGQFYQITLLLLALLFSRCAQIVPLTGGERDRTPPLLVEALPANNSLNFNQAQVILTFNEYVQLKDLNNQLMVSPRLTTPPEITASGKEVTVKFVQKELVPNTTYRLDFGNAIADMNESNSITGFTYVFSTGGSIDSLYLAGSVKSADDNQSAAGVLVGLYRLNDTVSGALLDSILYLVPPDYSTKTTEAGFFTIPNLPPAGYHVFALSDKNRNNLYDGGAEKVAFGKAVNVPRDSSINLVLFQEEPPSLFVKKSFSPFYGFAQVILNKPVRSTVSTLDPAQELHIYEPDKNDQKDTISVFYRELTDTLSLRVQYGELDRTDTVNIILPEKRAPRRRLRSFSSNVSGGRLAPGDTLRFIFPVWMDTSTVNPSRIRLNSADDSLLDKGSVHLKWQDIHTLGVVAGWRDGFSYTVQPDTGMVYDLGGLPNDTTAFNFKKQGKADFTKLTLNLLFPKKQAYVVQLRNSAGRVIEERSVSIPLSGSNRVPVLFGHVLPGTYRIRVIFDDNDNARWDTGKLLLRRQPEKVFMSTKELKLLADWEAEEEIIVADE